MKIKKLEKRVQFIFKRNPLPNLSKEQMRQIYGAGTTTEGGVPSTEPGCVENKPTLATVSN